MKIRINSFSLLKLLKILKVENQTESVLLDNKEAE